MLHVILCILKIIGILLLALILLVLLILLAVLFVPLRYRLSITQIPERGQGEAGVTWLLHSVRASYSYDLQQRKTRMKVFVFGRQVRGEKEKKQKPQDRSREGPKQKPASGPKPEQKTKPGPEAQPQPEPEPQPQPQPEQRAKSGSEAQSKPEPEPQPQPEQRARSGPEPKPERKPQKKSGQAPEPAAEAERGFFENLVYNVRHFCDTIKKIPKRIRRILERPQAAWEKLQGYRQLFVDYEVWDTAGEVKDELLKLLHHFRVRKGSGYFRFGTGDPASTAELAGFLYVILPASCGEISVEPQFNDSMLQTELTVIGHIRICHLAAAFWWGYRNKKLRRIISAFMDR